MNRAYSLRNTKIGNSNGFRLPAEEDILMMRLFLDFAIAQTLKNQELKPYNVEMSTIARGLIAGVELDDE